MLKQGATRNVTVFMTDSTDHITGKTGLTLTITASKDGAAFATITPTVTERGNGWYSLALTTSHTDTLGDLTFHVTGSGADPSDFKCQVVADLFGVAQTGDAYSRIGAAGAGLTALGDARLGNLDVAVSTRSILTATLVWDQTTAGHIAPGTFGGLMSSAASAGDPWATTIPGAYGAGTAGFMLGTMGTAYVTNTFDIELCQSVGQVENMNPGSITASTFATDAISAAAMSAAAVTKIQAGLPTAVQNADALIARNIEGGSNSGRTVAQALAALRNKRAFDVPSAGQFTVYAANDSTVSWTGTYTTSASADPVVAMDPT